MESLGDSPPRLIHETYPLPRNRKDLIIAVEKILELGKVQKLVVEVGQPIKYSRISSENSGVPEEAREKDLFSNIRQAEMIDLSGEKDVPFLSMLFKAFSALSARRLKPALLAVSNTKALRTSLGVDVLFDLSSVFGVPVSVLGDIPGDVILLCGTREDDDQISLSLRLLLKEAA